MTIEIVAATDADLAAIDDIERQSFPNPWPPDAFEAELRHAWARVDVVRVRDQVIGFCNYWLVPPELHLHVIAVRPDHRRQGIGAKFIRHILHAAARAGCNLATLEVRASNATAIRLYQQAGFATVHVRPRYYNDNQEDALVMSRSVP